MALIVLRSAHYARQPAAMQKVHASPDVSFLLALARSSRVVERRDESHFVTEMQSKMDPTTGTQVVRLRLYSAMLTETILSSLHGRRIQISPGTKEKITVPTFNVVSNMSSKRVTIEAGYCIGPILLLCLTFSTTGETFADFLWNWGTKVNSNTTKKTQES